MKEEILLALLLKKTEEKISSLPDSHPLKGPRGHRGATGSPGKDFDIEEHVGTLKAYAKEFALTFEDFTPEQISSLRGPQGREGRDGRDGKDFVVEEQLDLFKQLAEDNRLKFSDFTAEEIGQLRGPQGLAGKHGRDGKDFSATENMQLFEDLAHKYALKFDDLCEDQISQLRGPQGRDGRNGKDFNFEEHKEIIHSDIKSLISEYKDELRLKLSDLNADEIEQLRGPRGRDGNDGRSFNFEEHIEFFNSLKPKFSDFSAEEVETLRLKFSSLTDSEKSELKLTFEDLTDDEKFSLKGPRGAKGQKGSRGMDGKDGERGERGLRGHTGPRGLSVVGRTGNVGAKGDKGDAGQDAPFITDIRIEKTKNEFHLIVEMSDGSDFTTNSIPLPRPNVYVSGGGGVAMSGPSFNVDTILSGYDSDGEFSIMFDALGNVLVTEE